MRVYESKREGPGEDFPFGPPIFSVSHTIMNLNRRLHNLAVNAMCTRHVGLGGKGDQPKKQPYRDAQEEQQLSKTLLSNPCINHSLDIAC